MEEIKVEETPIVEEKVKIVEETPIEVIEEKVEEEVVEETPAVQIVSDTHINQDGGSITNNVDPSQDRGVQQ